MRAGAVTRPPYWYTAAWVLVLPFVALYLCWRAVRQPEYLRHWGERFLGGGAAGGGDRSAPPSAAGGAGRFPPRDEDSPLVWVHAVSVGETRAAQPLVLQLAQSLPAARFLLTHMTPTGRATGEEIARALPGRVHVRYLPYDVPWAVQRFLRTAQPSIGILMETEAWPCLVHAARARGIALLLANARLSQRSLDKALRYGAWLRAAAACVDAVAAQSEADRARIAHLYAGPVHVTGNLKFDLQPDAAQGARGRTLRAAFGLAPVAGGGRPVWLFASTRAGEEVLLLDALAAAGALPEGGAESDEAEAIGAAARTPLLLFVPRHPQRFDEVAALLRARGLAVLRRAAWPASGGAGAAGAPARLGARTVLLGDSMGEMALYYALADAALIGGSLLPLGGQNLIEACACGCPVVLGPHMFNFAAAAQGAEAAGAAVRVADASEAVRALARLTGTPPELAARHAAALQFAAAHRGATQRTAQIVAQLLASRAGQLR